MGSGVMRRQGRRSGKRHAPMSEINVTPFVDVMLVLLVIFMVAAPLLSVGVPVDLPQSEADALPSSDEQPLEVSINGAGQVFLMEAEVSAEELVPKLTAIRAERTDDMVYLRADAGVAHGVVAEIMGALSAGGVSKLTFVHETRR